MDSHLVRIERSNWDQLADEFERFFSDRGSLSMTADELSFDAGNTGLALRRDGTSRSFMPLHGLDARWDVVVFDHRTQELTLVGETSRYVYTVPPNLRRSEA